MADVLVSAIGELPSGSKAPYIVSVIYGDNTLSESAKSALAEMFMGLYRTYTADSVWVLTEFDASIKGL